MSTVSRRRDTAAASLPISAPIMEEAAAAAAAASVSLEDPMAAHERLVAYVHAINGDPEPRVGVWNEHSYAAAKGATGGGGGGGVGGGGHTRTLLLGGARSPPRGDIDVETVDPPPPVLPSAAPPSPPLSEESSGEEEEEAWEARLEGTAPSAGAARLAGAALGTLRGLRLARLAGARGEVRAAARSLRRALAAHWGPGGAAGWLHCALSAAPRRWRRLYRAVLAELVRAVPALVARLPPPAPPPAAAPHAPRAPPACMPMSSRPLLVWLGGGCEAEDARWERRLRALVPTHYVRVPTMEARDPVSWCGGAAAAARAALSAILGEAGGGACSLLAVGGAGAGAALALQVVSTSCTSTSPPLAPSGVVAALLLLAPPLLTAEGPRTAPDDPIAELSIPTLAVVSEQSSSLWRQAIHSVDVTNPHMRTVLVGGTDELLRVPARRRRRLRLPQHALDHAIVDECARWLNEVSEMDTSVGTGGGHAGTAAGGGGGGGAAVGRQGHRRHYKGGGQDMELEEYSHLPSPSAESGGGRAPHIITKGGNRAIEIVEGRVVTRVCGGTALALPAPRRAPPPPLNPAPSPAPPTAAAAPSPADIMSMPIVFADDEPPSTAGGGAAAAGGGIDLKGAPSAVTVKSGGGQLKFSKVIVAKRGVAGLGVGGGAGRGGRPIVVRGGVRLLRTLPPPAPPAPR